MTRAGWGTHAGQSHDTFPCTIDRRAHVSRGTAHPCVTGMLRILTARIAEEFESVYQYKRPLLLTAPNAVDLDAWQARTQRLLAQPQPVRRARRRLHLEKLLPALADCNVMIGTSDGIVENGGKGCVWLCAHRAAPSC